MGNFYSNYTIRGASQSAVASALSGRTAIVTQLDHDCVVVFDEESDDADDDILEEVATHLSKACSAVVLVALNHDDDIFWFQLYRDGERIDEYNSCPDYFGDDPEAGLTPTGGDAERLCSVFGSGVAERVERVLRPPADSDGYLFAVQRHEDFCTALGISHFGVGTSYESFEHEELPEGLDISQIQRVG